MRVQLQRFAPAFAFPIYPVALPRTENIMCQDAGLHSVIFARPIGKATKDSKHSAQIYRHKLSYRRGRRIADLHVPDVE